jgi:hypothetical protein
MLMKYISRLQLMVFSLAFVSMMDAMQINFVRHQIEISFAGMHKIKLVDIDFDGDLDIIGGSEITPTTASRGIALWRNDGGDPIDWTRFAVDESFIHVMSIDVDLVDGDTLPDIVATSWHLNEMAWWKNSGDPTRDWTKNTVLTNFGNAHDADIVDIDADGDRDIVAVCSTPGRLVICSNDGQTDPGWSIDTLSNSFSGAKDVLTIDLDEDGDLDIVGSADEAGELAWWKNDGGDPTVWSKTVITSDFLGAGGFDVIDMNGDNKKDIVAVAWMIDQLSYWICDDLETNSWSKNVISRNLPTPAQTRGADFDQDGDVDVVAVGKIPGEIAVFEQSNSNWNKILLTSWFRGGTALAVEDLDLDGDEDIIAGASIGWLFWWENILGEVVAISEVSAARPSNFHLHNYPNPFNPSSTIQYDLPYSSYVSLAVYDIVGRLVAILEDKFLEPGQHQVQWDGHDQYGKALPSGIYIARLATAEYSTSIRMILMK